MRLERSPNSPESTRSKPQDTRSWAFHKSLSRLSASCLVCPSFHLTIQNAPNHKLHQFVRFPLKNQPASHAKIRPPYPASAVLAHDPIFCAIPAIFKAFCPSFGCFFGGGEVSPQRGYLAKGPMPPWQNTPRPPLTKTQVSPEVFKNSLHDETARDTSASGKTSG